jgi:glutathione S-transferase
MAIEIAAFRWVPPFAQGYVRDLRIRWALEEAGFPYETVLIDFEIKETPAYRAWQPFGQVPAYRDGEVEMFESGAIVLYLAEKSEALSPKDAAGRARVMTWVVAALNSVEPHVQNYVHLDVFQVGEPWVEPRRPSLLAALEERLAVVCAQLDGNAYLTGQFSAADIMMACVLRELVENGVLGTFPILDAYRLRCEARPAFTRALEAQMAPFRQNAPA